MLKKVILFGLSSLCATTITFAGGLYLGAGLQYQDIFANPAGYQGIAPRLTLGFGNWISDSFYLGAEAFASSSPFTLIDDTNTSGDSLKISSNFGFSILPGFYLDDSLMLYLRGSILDTKFKAGGYKTGYQLGAGLEYKITEVVSIRGEYDYAQYSSFSTFSTPKSSEFGVSMLYRFLS